MRIDELLKAEPAIDDSAADPAIPANTVLRGEIEFRISNFSYGDTAVLRDISLHVPAGSSLAIVGPTGSGKTTLVNLLSRLFEAPDGSLLIDGRPVRDYPLAMLRRNIGMVPQETFLFSETIRENLLFGAPHATAEELLKPPKPHIYVRSSRSFRKALRPWWASAASRCPADKSSAPPSPGHCCAGQRF